MSKDDSTNTMMHFSSATLLCLLVWAPSLPAATFLYLDSDAGDFVGGGIEQTLDETDSTFRISRNYDNGVSVSSSQRTSSSSYWTLDFAAPGDIRIEPGMYTDATRFPFQSPTQPGLDVSGEYRGCNRSSGFFIVHEAEYATDDSVIRFAANFEQHCENGPSALRGAIRFNSDLPAVITTPIAATGRDQRVHEGDRVTLDGRYSAGGDSAIAAYQWRQTNGPQATLSDVGATQPEFTAPATALGGETLTFELTVINTNGESSSDEVEIIVASKSDPMSYLLLDSQSGDYIGGGIRQFFDSNDGSFSLSGTDNAARITFNNGDWWSLDFAASDNLTLTPGGYENISRAAFRGPGEPGLDVSGAGRACNTLTGRFDILAIRLSITGTDDSFAADFEQHCGGGSAALFGEIRINYIDPSVPRSNAGADQAVTANTAVSLDGSASVDTDGSIVTYLWEQTGGTSVTLSSESIARPSFTAPTPASGTREDLAFKLTVVDDAGFRAEDWVVITTTPDNGSSGGSGSEGNGSGDSGGAGAFFTVFLLLPALMLRRRTLTTT